MTRQLIIYIILAVCCIPLFYLNIYDVHTWGDDFAQYIREAINIANGEPYYKAEYIFNPLNPDYGPPQYPPGFPILLAPVVKVWGISFKPMLYLIAGCLAALLFVLYHFFKQHTKHDITAICLALICVYSGGVLELKSQILSDIPCWLFTAIYITIRQRKEIKPIHTTLAVLAGTMAILIRSQALVLLLAEAFLLLTTIMSSVFKEKRLSIRPILTSLSFKLIVSTSLLFIICNYLLFPTPKSGLAYYNNLLQYHQGSWFLAIQENAYYLYQLLIRNFQYFPWNVHFPLIFSQTIPYGIFVLAILGYFTSLRNKAGYLTIYFTLIIVLLVVLSQRQGVRFILYILPIYLLYAYFILKQIVSKNLRINGVILAVLFTIVYFNLAEDELRVAQGPPPDNYIPGDNEQQVFQYLKENVKADEVIVFNKPRLLSLLTKKKSIVHASHLTYVENQQMFNKVGVTHILIADELNDGYMQYYMSELNIATDTLQLAEGYTLYKFR